MKKWLRWILSMFAFSCLTDDIKRVGGSSSRDGKTRASNPTRRSSRHKEQVVSYAEMDLEVNRKSGHQPLIELDSISLQQLAMFYHQM